MSTWKRKWSRGDSINNATAEFMNLLVAVCDDYLSRRGERAGEVIIPPKSEIFLKNISQAHRGQYSIVRLGGPLVVPDDDLDSQALDRENQCFFGKAVFEIQAPTEGLPFAVLQEPCPKNGGIVRARISGWSWAKVRVDDAAHEYANAITNDYDKLKSQENVGIARIFYIRPDENSGARTGQRWCLVEFTHIASGGGGDSVTIITIEFVIVSITNTVNITVLSTENLFVNQSLVITDGTRIVYGYVQSITNSTTFVFKTTYIAAGTAGQTMTTGATVADCCNPITGTPILNGTADGIFYGGGSPNVLKQAANLKYNDTNFGATVNYNQLYLNGSGELAQKTPISSLTNGTFTIPAIGSSTTVTADTTGWILTSQEIEITDATNLVYGVAVVTSGTQFTFYTTAVEAGAVGNTMATAASIVPITKPLKTPTTATFVIPAVGSPVTVNMASTGWMQSGQEYLVYDGTNFAYGFLVPINATSATFYPTLITGGTAGNTMAKSATIVPMKSPENIPTTASFVLPAIGSGVTVNVLTTAIYKSNDTVTIYDGTRNVYGWITIINTTSFTFTPIYFFGGSATDTMLTRAIIKKCCISLNPLLGKPSPATTLTAGFPWFPGMSGIPTGTPSPLFAGFIPLMPNILDAGLWYYDGAWYSMTGGKKGADIASATPDLSAATGDYVVITGTTAITALGTLPAGIRKMLKFAGALTFTHHATSLILPTGASITTAAGDMALMISEGSGNWRCATYTRANGKSLVIPAPIADGGTNAITAVAALDNLMPASSNIASATPDLSAATGRFVTITGTTAITAFGTCAAGVERVLKFADVLVLTHNSTSLILLDGVNITTAAGDIAIFVSLGSGNWELVKYKRKASAVATATDGATVTFDLTKMPKQKVTLGGNRTLALSGDYDGLVFYITLKQDGTGSRTVTWWSNILWPAGTTPTLTTTASKSDDFIFIRISSTEYHGFVLGQNL